MVFKKEWFEPGPDGRSEFTKLYRKSMDEGLLVGHAISAAFRALLAKDDPPALRVGDVVRLEDPNELCYEQAIGIEATITGFRKDGNPNYTSSLGDSWWKASACTLVRRAGDAAPVDKDAEIARLTAERDALFNKLESRTLDRNVYALRCTDKDEEIARINVELHARNDEIVGLRAELENVTATMSLFQGMRDQSREYAEQYQSERDAARAEVERWKSIADAHDQNYNMMLKRVDEVAAERDAANAEVERLNNCWSEAAKQRDELQCQLDNERSALAIRKRQMNQAAAERDALQARIKSITDMLFQDGEVPEDCDIAQFIEKQIDQLANTGMKWKEKADALQARVDGGVRVYSATGELWSTNHKWSQFSKILIDAQPIADHIADDGRMVDERKGERRKEQVQAVWTGAKWVHFRDNGQHHKPSRDNNQNRRRAAGTRADRGQT